MTLYKYMYKPRGLPPGSHRGAAARNAASDWLVTACPPGAALLFTLAWQVRGRSASVGRARLGASSRLTSVACPAYPVEAYVAPADSVQADGLDARCVASRPVTRSRTRLRVALAWPAVAPSAAWEACTFRRCAQAHGGGLLAVLLCAAIKARHAVLQRVVWTTAEVGAVRASARCCLGNTRTCTPP